MKVKQNQKKKKIKHTPGAHTITLNKKKPFEKSKRKLKLFYKN